MMVKNLPNVFLPRLAVFICGLLLSVSVLIGFARAAEPVVFPPSASPQFCVALQGFLASTTLAAENTLFDDMPSYRHSKPSAEPLKIYQVVTYAKQRPIVVSCKMKTAAHLRAVYGSHTAGDQKFCPDAARALQQQAVAELEHEGQADLAKKLAVAIVDQDEPFITGQAYLKDFQTLYNDASGVLHIRSPGLYQEYDSWYTVLLPDFLKGQSYCHLATVESLKAVAAGELPLGTVITTQDDAPTRPQ